MKVKRLKTRVHSYGQNSSGSDQGAMLGSYKWGNENYDPTNSEHLA
jgi:hypothetical protein